jgi:hypothetical protein
MKKLILLLIIMVCITGCEKDKQHEKFFDPENLSLLNLANIDGFWDDDEIIDTSYNMEMSFESHSGSLKGINLYSEKKLVWISVFTTRDTAIDAMESRIKNVAALIEKGTSDRIKGIWWFSNDHKNFAVFVNKWNTIIEVVIFDAKNEGVENILYRTANELAQRVDNLSNSF